MKAIGNFARSSSFKVGVLFTLLTTAGVLFVAYFLYLATEEVFLKESEVALSAELDGLSYVYRYQGEIALSQVIESKKQKAERDFYYIHLAQSNVRPYSDVQKWQAQQPVADQIARHIGVKSNDLMWQQRTFSDGSLFIVARDAHDLEVAQWVARTFGSLTILTMLSISGLSLLVGFYVVKTINKIADSTDHIIQSGDFSQRIPIDSSWDDLSKLSLALNGALDALAQKVEGIKSVSDNIAHDLRTPITRLRARIEGLPNEQQKQNLLNEVDTIMAMFKGLLRIADIEASKHTLSFADNRLDTIIEDVIDLYQPLADDKQQVIDCELQAEVFYSDRDLLFQALANLLDNAIKFTPQHGRILITLNKQNDALVIRLCDSGPGVSEQDAAKLTRRFFRTDASRHEAGHGLGLAMVDAVVKRHNGALRFTHNKAEQGAKGLCCELKF